MLRHMDLAAGAWHAKYLTNTQTPTFENIMTGEILHLICCKNGHSRVWYEGDKCPCCLAQEEASELSNKINELERALETAEDNAKGWEKRTEALEFEVERLKEALNQS